MNMSVTSEAIIFLEDNGVAREILYPEFEALLDHVVGIDEYKNTSASAIYVRINKQLQVTSAVCFLVDFDSNGHIDNAWNVPLRHLADSGGRGPDLGAGPIKLSCRNQCSVSWHHRSLWDPILGNSGEDTLTTVAEVVKRNRLGLMFEPKTDTAVAESSLAMGRLSALKPAADLKINPAANAALNEVFEERISEVTATYKLRLATMKSEAQDHLERVQRHHRIERGKLTESFVAVKNIFAEEKHKNLKLKKKFEVQANSLKKVRLQFQKQLQDSKTIGNGQVKELEEKFEQELNARVDAAMTELKEILDMRDIQLFYRDEQVSRMEGEIALFKKEKQSLVEASGDKVLQQLVESGVSFIAYQPGADHLTIPLKDIGEYVDSPETYVAEKLSVDRITYKQWLKHYQMPLCIYSSGEGSVCGKSISTIDKPGRFIAGESDRCAEHSRAAATLSELMKVR
jgi:hypothetical protein